MGAERIWPLQAAAREEELSMTDQSQFEIPAAMRDMAERNVEQTRTAYTQLLDMMRQAQDLVSKSAGAVTQSTLDIQARTMRFTEQNIEASFSLASELARARDLKEYFEIQSKHAQRQMQAYSNQAQELGRLMTDAARKMQSGP
jgi:phasin